MRIVVPIISMLLSAWSGVLSAEAVYKSKIGLDDYMNMVVKHIVGVPVFSSDINPSVKVEGTLVLVTGVIADADKEKVTELFAGETWLSPMGVLYDFSSALILIPEGGAEDKFADMIRSHSLIYSAASTDEDTCDALLVRAE